MVGENYPAQTSGSGLLERGRRFQCLGAALYDALLDDYEPGARSAELTLLFQALREELVPLVQTISEASARRTRDGQDSQGGAGARATRSSGGPIHSIGRRSLERRSRRRWVSTFSGAGWT